MPLRRLTMSTLMSWEPCYDSDEVQAIAARRKSISPGAVANLDIPAEDKMWLLTKWCHAIGGERASRLLACDIAASMLPLFEAVHSDTRPRECIATARRFAEGDATQKELDAARAAARAAAQDAVHAAALATARAARDAARAARGAAWVAWDATWGAAWAARAATIAHAIRVVKSLSVGKDPWSDDTLCELLAAEMAAITAQKEAA